MRNTLLAQAFFASKKNQNPTNIYEMDKNYLIEIETPYFTEDDLTIRRVADGIHVKGEKTISLPEPFKSEKMITKRLDRLIQLKKSFTTENIEASLTEGVLHISIAKQPVKIIPINIR